MPTYCLVFKVQSSKSKTSLRGRVKKKLDKEAIQKLHKDREPEASRKIN